MERAYHFYIQSMGLLEQGLYLIAVFSDDVAVVSAGFVHVITLKVDLIGKDGAVEGPESTKSVSRKQSSCGLVESHHYLRPMDHRRKYEFKHMMAGVQGVTFIYHKSLVCQINIEKLIYHGYYLFVAYDLCVRISEHQFA